MRAWRFFFSSLPVFLGDRFFSSSAPMSQADATRVRSKGYGPTKDLLRGVDTTKRLLVETDLHPADAEMQRCVLSLTSPDVKVYTSLDSNADAVESSGVLNHEGIAAISPEQLASVATVIVDQVREQLELSSYVSEAAQDGRAGSVVNAVANCLKEEMERLLVTMQSHEVSFARLLQENSDVICDKIAGVIQRENSQPQVKGGSKDTKQISVLMREVSAAVKNLEGLLKTKLDASLGTESTISNSVIEDMRSHLAEVIEQSSRVQQENLLLALRDMDIVPTSRRAKKDSAKLEAVQRFVKDAMAQVVDEAKCGVQELLTTLREKSTQHSDTVTAENSDRTSALEKMLMSYGERLEEMKEFSTRHVDIKELVMELHSQQQANEMAIHEVGEGVKKLKKELKSALREAFLSASAETAAAKSDADQLAKHSDKVDDLAERVTTGVVQQLEKHYANVDRLPKQMLLLEQKIMKMRKAELIALSSLQEIDDTRLPALAQSISDSIIASLPQTGEPQKPLFTKSELAEAVAEVLRPKLDELATSVVTKAVETAKSLESTSGKLEGESFAFLDEQQLVTLAQTIAESVRDEVQKPALSEQNLKDVLSKGEEGVRAVTERLEDLKNSILTNLKKEMERTHEVDITPFQAYIDDVIEGLKGVLSEGQAAVESKTETLAEALLERLEKQQVLLKEMRDKQKAVEDHLADVDAKGEVSATDGLSILGDNLIKEIKKIATQNSATVLSSLDAVQKEVRSVAGKLPLAVEERLSKIDTSLSEAQKAENDRSVLLQTTLQDMHTSIVSASKESGSAKQLLESINSAVSDLAQQSVSSVADMKSQMTASEGRAATLHAQTTTDLSRRLVSLHEELQNGKQQIEQLLSFSSEYKGVASAVEAMEVKLGEATSLLDGINTLLETQGPGSVAAREAISARLDMLSAATHDILLELREYRSAQKEKGAPSADAKLTAHTLEQMENRLNKQLWTLQEKLDEVARVGSFDLGRLVADDTAVPLQEQQLDWRKKRLLEEIDALLKLLRNSPDAQAKKINDRLSALRLLVLKTAFYKVEADDTDKLLELLEENRLKLRDDVKAAETALVGEVSSKMHKTLEGFLTSIDQHLTPLTDLLLQKLQTELDSNRTLVISEQKHVALELHDRLNELEKTLETCLAGMKDGMQKALVDELHDAVQQATMRGSSANINSVIEEACKEQLRSVENRVDEYGTLGEQNSAQLLSKMQRVSDDISGFAGDVRVAMDGSSTEVIEEIQRTRESLTEKLEQHLSVLKEQLPGFLATSLSSDKYKYTHKDTAVSSVHASLSLPWWWLFLLSLVIIASMMICAYLLFAAFLVAFVPLPPKSTRSNDDSSLPRRPPSTRVVDQVML